MTTPELCKKMSVRISKKKLALLAFCALFLCVSLVQAAGRTGKTASYVTADKWLVVPQKCATLILLRSSELMFVQLLCIQAVLVATTTAEAVGRYRSRRWLRAVLDSHLTGALTPLSRFLLSSLYFPFPIYSCGRHVWKPLTITKKVTLIRTTAVAVNQKARPALAVRQAEPEVAPDDSMTIETNQDDKVVANFGENQLFARHLCPACPTGAKVLANKGKNNGNSNVVFCCPRQQTKTVTRTVKTIVKTQFRTKTKTTAPVSDIACSLVQAGNGRSIR